jgi:purine-binding chemotaxis protein CheW
MESKKQDIGFRDIYGSFSLSGTEFAISVKSIQEVVNEPDHYKSIPLSPDYLLGLFNLRGMIIPVVDLRRIFRFPETAEVIEKKIAIIEHGDLCVGILFDTTCEVFNGSDIEKNDFNEKENTTENQVVQGVFKLDDGNRIIQILDPFKILNLNDLPRPDISAANKSNRKNKGPKIQCISFQVGNANCSLGINAIQEIVRVKKIDNTALSNEICLGAINVRSNTIPVIDFSKILGYKPDSLSEETLEIERPIIIMKLGDGLFGLLVNSVENIISYFEEELVKFPVLSERKKDIFQGCISIEGQEETILLDHLNILSNSEVDRITRGHSNLYKEKAVTDKKLSGEDSSKKTYITFSVENNYGLEITEVNEVIDCPKDFLVPPSLSKNFKGMINLRGNLIAVIDPRILYEIHNSQNLKNQKILIFQIQESKFGLLVDTVNSILSFQENDKMSLPQLLYKGGQQSLSQDVKEAIQISNFENQKTTLMVLNLEAIWSRISLAEAS